MFKNKYLIFFLKLVCICLSFMTGFAGFFLCAEILAATGNDDDWRIPGDTYDYEGSLEYDRTELEVRNRLAAECQAAIGTDEWPAKFKALQDHVNKGGEYITAMENRPQGKVDVQLPWQEPRRHYSGRRLRVFKGPHMDPYYTMAMCTQCQRRSSINPFGCFVHEAWSRYCGFSAWNVIPLRLLLSVGRHAYFQDYAVGIHYPMIILIIIVLMVFFWSIFFFIYRGCTGFTAYRVAVFASTVILLTSFVFIFFLHWQQYFARVYGTFALRYWDNNSYYPEAFFSYMVTTPFGPFGFDHLSSYFIFLTCLTSFFAICSAYDLHPRLDHCRFYSLIFAIQFFMIMTFSAVEFLHFYIFFEASMIPMFLIIGYWGTGSRATFAAYTFFFYTMLGSVFLLFALICLNFWSYLHVPTGFRGPILWGGLTRYGREDGFGLPTFRMPLYGDVGNGYPDFLQMCQNLPLGVQLLLFICMFVAFAVKVPIIPFHRWLPEAHVEAPTAGSVLLAGVLLKLGGYGLIRVSVLFPLAIAYLKPFILILAFVSVLYSSIIIFYQHDFKKIIAYASIGHMNYVVLGLFSGNYYGLTGAIYVMISHAFTSVALFIAIGFLYYRYGTRNIFRYGDLVTNMPIFTFFLFLGCLANFSFPGTGGFIGEFLVFLSLVNLNWLLSALMAFTAVLGVIYTIWFFNRLCFRRPNYPRGGVGEIVNFDSSDLSAREVWVMVLVVVGAYIIGLFPNYIMSNLDGFSVLFLWYRTMLSGLVV